MADANPGACSDEWRGQFYLLDPKPPSPQQQPLIGALASRVRGAGGGQAPGKGAAASLEFKELKGKRVEAEEMEVGQMEAAGITGGHLKLANLPTNGAGLVAGEVWSDNGVLKIAPSFSSHTMQ